VTFEQSAQDFARLGRLVDNQDLRHRTQGSAFTNFRVVGRQRFARCDLIAGDLWEGGEEYCVSVTVSKADLTVVGPH
jgi:hypothetical protein